MTTVQWGTTAVACPLRIGAYQPGCSTAAVNPLEHTRLADLHITSLIPLMLVRIALSDTHAYSRELLKMLSNGQAVAY